MLLPHCFLVLAFVTWVRVKVQNVSGFFFYFFNDNTMTTLLNPFFYFPLVYLNKVFGAGQLDVAAQAVSARSDTL